jgi:hypothetical protein
VRPTGMRIGDAGAGGSRPGTCHTAACTVAFLTVKPVGDEVPGRLEVWRMLRWWGLRASQFRANRCHLPIRTGRPASG